METSSAFLLIGVIITLAAFLGAWAIFFKQPIFIAYIIAGIVAGPLIFRNPNNVETFNLLRDLGLSFVLFLIGLYIKKRDLKRFGPIAFQVGLKQVVITAAISILVAKILGFSFGTAFYIGIALAFSSTIVAVKLLIEKKDYDSLYGELTVAILLLQDFVAIAALILISSFTTTNSFSPLNLSITAAVGAAFLAAGFYLNKTVLPYVFERIAYNSELLFIGALAWLFIVAAISSYLGFSIEIGAFLAGVGLANLPQEHQIAARIRPLRDFFILIFFILIGARLALTDLKTIIIPAIVLSAFVLAFKPIITMFLLSREGFKKRTSFMTGISIAQVSEFSLVLLFLGQKVGQIDQRVVGVVTLVALITIAVSSYLVKHGTGVYRKVSKYLNSFEPREKIKEASRQAEIEDHFILVGAGRLGWDILNNLRHRGERVLVVEFNPAIVERLEESGVPVLFGDVTDPEIQKTVAFEKAKMIISTIFDPEDTQELLDFVNKLETKIPVVVTGATEVQGLDFYKSGAAYVIIPRVISGKVVSNLLNGDHLQEIIKGSLRSGQVELLSERLKSRIAEID